MDGDRILTDSASILVYLAGTHSDSGTSKTPSSFWSNDAADQASIVEWLAFSAGWIKSGVCNARGLVKFKTVSDGSGAGDLQSKLEGAQALGKRSLGLLEKRLEKQEWLTLGRPTVADVSVFPYVALAPVGDISLDPYPAVRSWIMRVRGLPRFIPMHGLDDLIYWRRG